MEKIRKALDLASEQRAQRPVAGGGGATPTAERRVAVADGLSVYSYTRTRVYEPSPDALERNRVLPSAADSLAGEAFRMLRTQVLQRMDQHGWRTLAVVSPTPDDGRSTAAANLAVALAADPRHSVLLCDLDLRSPSIAALFDLVPVKGVDDVLTGRAVIEDCLAHPQGFDRLVLLPARASVPGSSEILAGPVVRRLVQEIRERYSNRRVIFDLPPVLVADDALAFSTAVDCALLVVSEGRTQRSDVVRCLEVLKGTPVVGTVLNRSDSRGAAAV